jgi:hypothetical protein
VTAERYLNDAVATDCHVQEHRFWEECFKVYERGVK